MFEELKLKYKTSSLAARLMLCCLLGLLPGAFIYYEQAEIVDAEYAAAESEEKAATQKLLDADKKLKNLEKTESELAFTTQQLKKAETQLPTQVAIDEILRQVGKTAKELSVTVVKFEPLPDVIRGDEYKYSEIPIKVTVEAHEYSQLCAWVDNVAGLSERLFLKSWSMKRESGRENQANQANLEAVEGEKVDEVTKAEQDARRPRENLRLVLAGEFSVYRMAPSQALPIGPDQTTPSGGADSSISQPEQSTSQSARGTTLGDQKGAG